MTRPEFCHQIFLKLAKFNLSPKSNDTFQILLWISNLPIKKVQFLMELDLAGFFDYQKIFCTMCIEKKIMNQPWKNDWLCLRMYLSHLRLNWADCGRHLGSHRYKQLIWLKVAFSGKRFVKAKFDIIFWEKKCLYLPNSCQTFQILWLLQKNAKNVCWNENSKFFLIKSYLY